MRTKTASRHIWRIILLSGLVLLALAGCGTETNTADASGGLQAWLDQPPTGSSIPLAPFMLKAHASDIGGSGVSQISFLVNTIPVAAITTDPTLPLAYAETEWNPAAPGEYEIQAQAFNAEGWVFSDMATICVGDNCGVMMVVAEAPTEEGPSPTPTETDTPIPGVTPSETPTPTITPTPTNTPTYTPTYTPIPSVCEMAVPVNTNPPNGGTVDNEYPTLSWSYTSNDCPVQGYRIDIATDAGMTNIVQSGGTGNPSTSWAPGQPLADCTTYYWHVAGAIETTLGPFSAPTAFTTAFPGGCGAPSDTTGPNLTVRVTPSKVTYWGNYCTKDDKLVSILAVVSDDSGIASVTAQFRYMDSQKDKKGDWHDIAMTGSGGSYNGMMINNNDREIISGSYTYVRIRVTATDTYGNPSQQTIDLQLMNCIG
jgi:hypothetical protein